MLDSSNLIFAVKEVFLGRVFTPGNELMADGGEKCYNQLTNQFRFSIYSGMALFHLFLYLFLTRSHMEKIKISPKSPNMLEKILGITQILVFLLQLLFKGLTFRLIFCLSHCHLCTFLQGYLLLSKSSARNNKVFASAMIWSTGAFLGLVYPEPGLITYQFELILFWVQHLFSGLLVPILLVYTNRYNCDPTILTCLFVRFIKGYHSFSWFCRVLQGPFSVLTMANINYQLCFPDEQILYVLYGKWYLPMGELSVIPVSILYAKSIHTISKALRHLSPSGKNQAKKNS